MRVLTPLALLTAGLIYGNVLQAQNYNDVLRYSQKFHQGTARSVGSGSAFGALGADFSSISINPAGLGVYRKPEFNVGFDLNVLNSSSNYLNYNAVDDKYNLNINNMGLVVADTRSKMGKPITDGWVSINFAIGFNRTNNFHSNVAVEGYNTQNSIVQSWRQDAEGYLPGQLDQFSYGYMAYQTYLLDPFISDSTQYVDATMAENPSGFKTFQGDYISTKGAQNDINIALAGNYSNKLYIGGSLMIPTIGYHYTRTFTETNVSDSPAVYYKGATLKEFINTSGAGISAAFGAIYRPTDALRLGASVQLPTFYALSDDYGYEISSDIVNSDGYTQASPRGSFKYSMVTPMHSTFSAAWLFEKYGFISVDYELVDYSAGRLNYDGSRDQNRNMEEIFRTSSNLRIGAEYRYGMLAFRAGYGIYGSPYNSKYVPDKYNGASNSISFGFGLRDKNYFLDLAYQRLQSNYFYLPYALNDATVEGANITTKRNSIMLTVGSRF